VQNYRKLTQRFKRFVEAMAKGATLTDAALIIKPDSRAPRKLGWKLCQKPVIAAAIEELEAETAREAGVTRLQVLLDAVTIKRRCMQAEPVLDRKGNPTGEYVFDSTGANKANEFLGKYLRIAPERHELTGKDGEQLPAAQQTVYIIQKAEAQEIRKDLDERV
jgi:phage terminase small subunit